MKKIRFSISSMALHGVLLLTVLGLGLDIYLRIALGSSICPTEACAIVGDFINISELSLVVIGLVFFALFWGSYFFASRLDRKWLWTWMCVLIFGALAFDGALLGFQYFSIQEQCQLCLGVGLALLVILFLFALTRKNLAVLVLGLTVWIGGGVGGAMINIPDRAPLLEQMRGITWSGHEARDWPKFYYFFSLHCPHCTDVLVNLATNEPRDYTWKLFPLDTSPADLKKIAWIMNLNMNERNVFYEFVRIEQSREVPDVDIPQRLVHNIEQTRSFFSGNGFRGVPLMIVDQSPGNRIILTGGGNIINYLYEQGILGREN